MDFLVTGACGFIGTNLSQELMNAGHRVLGVDSFTQNYSIPLKTKNFEHLKKFPMFEFLHQDLLEADIHSILEGKDGIFHLAGQPSVQNSWGVDFQTYVDRNVVLTHRLLRAALESGVEKFVNSSSSSIYGKVKHTPTLEDDTPNPVSPYGVTKLAGEHLCTLYGKEFGLNTVSLRYFTVYGPRQRPDMAFNKLVRAAIDGTTFPLHGDGSQIRDFTFVGDVVNANILAMEKTVPPGTVINIGGGSPVTMKEVIKKVENSLHVEIKIEQEGLGYGNPLVTSADCTRAAGLLGWTPKTTMDEGLQRQIDWQLAHGSEF